MSTALADISDGFNTRLWPRHQVSVPVLISAEGDPSKPAIPGLACEISQRGMALYGGIDLQPGDLMEVEFQNSPKTRVSGIIRNRSGFCFGLEFLESVNSPETIDEEWQPGSPEEQEEVPSWKAWFATHRGDVSVGVSALLLLLAFLTAGSQSTQDQIVQTQPSQPSLTLSEQMLVSLGFAEAPDPPKAMGNPGVVVWEDLHTALYYCPGSDLYGKTPNGKLTTQRDAQLDQFEPAMRKSCE